jgi:predicted PurR-regulated permease PerM
LGFKARGFRESGIFSEQQFHSNGSNMSFPDRRTVDVLLTTLLFMGVCSLVYSARRVILVFVVAILFAYLINPIVRFLERHSLFSRNLRGPAVVEVYLLLLILIAIPAHSLVPALLRQAGTLIETAPALLTGQSPGEFVTEIGGRYGWTDVQELRLRMFLARHREEMESLVRAAEQHLPTAVQAMGYLLVIPILAVFFLREGEELANALILFFTSPGNSETAHKLAEELDAVLRKYIKAKVELGSLSLVVYSLTMLLFGCPYAIALGIFGGLLDCIPVVGGILAVTAIISVGALAHTHWIWMAVLLAGWRMVQDYVIAPRVMGHNLEIHRLMAIFAVMAGWEVGGLLGIYLALPLTAVAGVIWRSYVSKKSSALLQGSIHQHSSPVGVLSR